MTRSATETVMDRPRLPMLWYIADPMCSWCWGFAPVIERIKAVYGERMKIALVLGGLRPGTTAPVTAAFRAEILHHWHDVHQRTGQPFAFDTALPEGFVYDTEPAARAVVTVGALEPGSTFGYFKAVQTAFYAEARDVTRAEVLADVAGPFGVERVRFLEHFESDESRRRTLMHFRQSRELGVQGFPTAILQNAAGYALLTSGWRPFEELAPQIDEWLTSSPRYAS
jgi:putative protein-disulfide isomerase